MYRRIKSSFTIIFKQFITWQIHTYACAQFIELAILPRNKATIRCFAIILIRRSIECESKIGIRVFDLKALYQAQRATCRQETFGRCAQFPGCENKYFAINCFTLRQYKFAYEVKISTCRQEFHLSQLYCRRALHFLVKRNSQANRQGNNSSRIDLVDCLHRVTYHISIESAYPALVKQFFDLSFGIY